MWFQCIACWDAIITLVIKDITLLIGSEFRVPSMRPGTRRDGGIVLGIALPTSHTLLEKRRNAQDAAGRGKAILC